MQLVGYSWDQAGAALELLQGCLPSLACYLGIRSLSFLHRFGIGLVPLHWGHLLIVIQEGRCLAGTEQKLLGFEKRGHVAFARVPGEREANASCRQGNAASQISWCRRTLYKLPPRVPLLSKTCTKEKSAQKT